MNLIEFKGGSAGWPVWICPDQVVRVCQGVPLDGVALVIIDLINGQSSSVQGTVSEVVAALTAQKN